MKEKKKSALAKILITVLILSIVLIISFGIYVYANLDKEVDISLFKSKGTSSTKIYYYEYDDRQNRVGIPVELKEEELFLEKSEWKSIYDMPSNLKNAFIAVEDKRFYEHKGVDWMRTAKAFLNYIFKFDKSGYGGSTITQQLIKNVTGDNSISPKRKLEEIFRARNIEKNLSKNEILESYLNVVYMSQNCYGVQAASKLYFCKDVSDLTLAECASLASIVQNPKKYDPYTNMENNKSRRGLVLQLMWEQGYIDKEEYEQARQEEVRVSSQVENNRSSGIYSWYTEAMLDEISTDMSKKYNLNKSAVRGLILKGGFNIYSVIDPSLQKQAEEVYKSHMAYMSHQDGKYPQSSCVIIDPYTNDVLALVGGTGEKTGNLVFNRATDAKRPPGSVIKPLSVYSLGLENGAFNYSSVYDDTPLKLTEDRYWPKNSPNKFRGLVPISYAVEHSINTVAVKALKDVGIDNSINHLKRLGIMVDETKDKNEASLALGQLTYGESLLNITNAYCSFVNGGEISSPKTYLKVTDAFGNGILEKNPKKNRVMSRENAYIMTMMLKGVVDRGTASCISLKGSIDTAGKTGTSSGNEDKWFVGYTPYYVCGVWTGFDTPAPLNYLVNPSCTLFDAIMKKAHENLDLTRGFESPGGIYECDVCFDSGGIPTESCRCDPRGLRSYKGYFKFSDIPRNECNIHKTVDINISTGKIATGFVPFWKKRRVSLLNYERELDKQITVLDDEYLISNRI